MRAGGKQTDVLIPLRDHNPRIRFPLVTLVLVLTNVGVYLWQLTLSRALADRLVWVAGAIPREITSLHDFGPPALVPIPLTIFTSMFLHGGLLHVVGNMWFLWVFGDNVEDRLGRARFLAFYLVTGTIGAVAQCLMMPGSPAPMIGASGAVAGVLGGYILNFPHARVVTLVLFWFIDVPAWVFLSLWFLAQFTFGASSGIAWMAHVGGFLAGLGLIRIFAPSRRPAAVEGISSEYLRRR
jgi:membrane associated rhomboid family serine protease